MEFYSRFSMSRVARITSPGVSIKRTGEVAMVPISMPPAKRRRLEALNQPVTRGEVNRIIASKSDHKNTIRVQFADGVGRTGTTYDLLDQLAQGDSLTNGYNGAFIQPKNVTVRFNITNATGDTSNNMRLILFQWFEDSAPTPASILALTGTANAPYCAWLWENRPYMKILRDTGPIALQADPAISNGGNGWSYSGVLFTKKLRKVWMSAATGVVKKNGIYLLVISDSTVAPNPSVAFTSQVVYTDGL